MGEMFSNYTLKLYLFPTPTKPLVSNNFTPPSPPRVVPRICFWQMIAGLRSLSVAPECSASSVEILLSQVGLVDIFYSHRIISASAGFYA